MSNIKIIQFVDAEDKTLRGVIGKAVASYAEGFGFNSGQKLHRFLQLQLRQGMWS